MIDEATRRLIKRLPRSVYNADKSSLFIDNGSSRIVYGYRKNKVIKVVNEDDFSFGIKQNLSEIRRYNKFKNKSIAKIYTYDVFGRWIIAEKLTILKSKRMFKQIFKADWSLFQESLEELDPNPKLPLNLKKVIGDIKYMTNHVLWFDIDDLVDLYQWGINSKGRLVLADYGL